MFKFLEENDNTTLDMMINNTDQFPCIVPPGAHLAVYLLSDMSGSFGQIVWRSDSAQDFLQLWDELVSAPRELQDLFVDVYPTLTEKMIKYCLLFDTINIPITTMKTVEYNSLLMCTDVVDFK